MINKGAKEGLGEPPSWPKISNKTKGSLNIYIYIEKKKEKKMEV